MRYLVFFITLLFLWSCSAQDTLIEPNIVVSQEEEIITPIPDISFPLEPMKIEDTCTIFDDFLSSQDFRWGVVNDGVMWGKSAGTWIIENNTLIFSGKIVTRGGGFSSLRGSLESGMLSEYNSVKLRAKSDGREYRITFRDSRWGNISHRAIIPFETVWEFEEITINFSDLEPAYFGRNVDADRFDKNSAREIGVILSDGVDGDFRLEIDEVRFCR